ncbi:hypothetical protein E4U54_004509 [Claviceps lovelessii]|nr:hypothetical protein E4U54_004509 [Claviceps lovelessii]
MTVTKASTCCSKDGAECACENAVAGPRCSCRARPAGECTCDRAATENAAVSGSKCSCGSRPADACTCEKASDGGFNPALEVDFTTRK